MKHQLNTAYPAGKYMTAGESVEEPQFPPPQRPPELIAELKKIGQICQRCLGRNLLDSGGIIRHTITLGTEVLDITEDFV